MAAITRRGFLKATAGGAAVLAALFGEKYVNKLVSMVEPDPLAPPGEVTLIASTCRECPAGCGLHVRYCNRRVLKVEGNPMHPVNRGRLCARGQSGPQGLYDPDRVRTPLQRDETGRAHTRTWKAALDALAPRLEQARRVVLLSDLQTGTMAAVLSAFARSFGDRPPLYYEAIDYPSLREAHRRAFDRPVVPSYQLADCGVIVSFAADFLETWVSPVEYACQFAEMRSLGHGRMGRFLYVGPRQSMTAANADEVIYCRPGAEKWVAWAMLAHVAPRLAGASPDQYARRAGADVKAIVRWADRFAAADRAVALAGPAMASGPDAIDTAEAAALLNHAAGQLGRTMDLTRPHALSHTSPHAEVVSALEDLGPDDVLIVHNTNPAHSLPACADWLTRAGTSICLDTLATETAECCEWLLPIDSPLESWGDYLPREGVLSSLQPCMGRIHKTRAAGDILIDLARAAHRPLDIDGQADGSFRDVLWRRWASSHGPDRENLLRRGGQWSDTPDTPATRRVQPKLLSGKVTPPRPDEADGGPAARLWVTPSIMLYDGRTANRGWIQEAPDPVSYATWGSWVDIHPNLARAHGLRTDDLVELQVGGARLSVPVRITQEVHPGAVGLHTGQGHSSFGRQAQGVGVNAFALLDKTLSEPFATVTLRRVGRRERPAYVSPTQSQYGREVLQWISLSEVRSMRPGQGDDLILPLPEGYRKDRDLYPPREYKKHRWAMVVDLHRCTGCGACAVACYAENNIAVVGRKNVQQGYEMAWIKAVPYRHPREEGRIGWLPLLCQHCDSAPCEPVCPVFASVHNEEGLNSQVYNRCIGTRYCSNNCPYKVRRFNWHNHKWPEPLHMQLNPDVTVRCRGVMEKCTFCVQRIRAAEYQARKENRPVRDGEIVPACAQTCPTGAFVFGDLLDPRSRVTQLTRKDPRRYHVLEDLNTKPAVTYLRRLEADE